MDRESLLSHARDALAKLYQESLLQIHPLAGFLIPHAPVASRGALLKQLLLDAMQQLRPAHTVAYDAPAWRRYRSLFQYYLEGKGFDEIAKDHGISDRQARRDYRQAIEMLGDILWARYCQIHPLDSPLASEAGQPGEEPSLADDPALGEDLRRIGSLPAAEPIQIDDALRGVVPMVQKLADRLGTSIDLAIAADLPPVTINQTVLRQALLSALSCVLESAPGGRVVVSAMVSPLGIDVVVRGQSDDGDNQIFGDDGSRLELSQRLLEMQGGGLVAEMAGSRCASVRLTLPSVRLPTVLVVDDNPDVIRLFQRFLQSANYRLIQATSVEQALQLARETRPRLITLDLMMPFRDGWDLLQILTRDHLTRNVPIVVCSVVHERTLALTMGASYFLPKPVTQASLLEMLEQCGLGPVDHLQARP